MKKNTFRSLTFITFCLSLFAVLTVCASAKTVKSGDYVFDVNGNTAALVEYTGSRSTVSVPSKVGTATVTKINDYAFWANKKVTKITLPSTVTTIGDAVFNECTSLTKVILPTKLVTMGDSVFWFCTNLKTVVFGSAAKTFGTNIFTGCHKDITAYVVKGSAAEKYIKTQKTVRLGYRYVSSLSAASSATVILGQPKKLSVTVSPGVVYDSRLSYSSSDTGVLTVASDGTMKALKLGKATVTCKAKDGSGKTVSIAVTVLPARGKILKQSKTTLTGYRLDWAKIEGATAYRVYRYDTKTKKWVTLGDTKKTYCTIKNRPYYSTDMYRVKGYSKIGKLTYGGQASPTFTAKVIYADKVTGMTGTSFSTDKVTFSWKPAAYADGYNVYSYDFTAKKYTLIARTASVSYTADKLSPNREYGFAVKAYSLDGTKRVLAKSHSGLFYISTTPAAVEGLRVKADSAGFDRLTVEWNKADNISGYTLSYSADGQEAKTLTLGADVTSADLSGLMPGNRYTVSLKAYSTRRSVNYFSASVSITAETEYIPTTPEQAVSSFVKAFGATRSTNESFTLLRKQKVTADVNNLHTVNAEKVSSAVSSQFPSFVQYDFTDGIEETSGITPDSVLRPFNLTADELDKEKVSVQSDQNGFRIGFVLEDQTADTEPEKRLAPIIDTEKIESDTGLSVVSVQYDKTVVSQQYTKIQNGLFDNLKVTSTVTVTVNDGEDDIPLTFDVEQMFYFLWA